MLNGYTLDKNTPVPLYFQLKTLLLEKIKDGTYPCGAMIPTENELSSMFDISRTTVRQAVTELVREGYLYRIKSKGTFVSKPKMTQQLLSRYYSYEMAARNSDRELRIEVLKKKIVPMSQEMVDLGGGALGDQAIYLHRKRFVDGLPVMHVESYLPYAKFPELLEQDLEGYSLREMMDHKPETKVYKLVRTIEAIPANQRDADILEIEVGSAVQLMTTIRRNEAGEFLDMAYSYFRGDMNRIEVEIIMPDEID